MNKYLKLTLKILAGLLLVSVIIFGAISYYVSSQEQALIGKLKTEIGKKIGGEILLKHFSVSFFNNFPSLALQAEGLEIRDSLFQKHQHPLIKVEKIYLRLNPFSLLTGKPSFNKLEIDGGQFYLFTDSSGYSNKYLLAKKDSTQKDQPDSLHKKSFLEGLPTKIGLYDFLVTIDAQTKNQYFAIGIKDIEIDIVKNTKGAILNINQSLLIHSLAFKKAKGSFLTNKNIDGKYQLEFDEKKAAIAFKDMNWKIDQHPFVFNGAFVFGAEKDFNLSVESKALPFNLAKSILTEKIQKGLNRVTIKYPINVDTKIVGKLAGGGNPFLLVNFHTEKNHLTTSLMDFTDASFQGIFTNQVRKDSACSDENSAIELTNFTADWNGINTKMKKITIDKLKHSIVTADLSADFPIRKLNSILNGDALLMKEGNCSLMLNYHGPFKDFSPNNASINGLLKINDGHLELKKNGAAIKNANANIKIINNDIQIVNISGLIGANSVRINGLAKNVLAILGESNEKANLVLQVNSPQLNISSLSNLFGRPNGAAEKVKQKSGGLAKTVYKVDKLLTDGDITLNIAADRVLYQRFFGTNFRSSIRAYNNGWEINQIHINDEGGSLDITGAIRPSGRGGLHMNANLNIANLDAQKVWYQFNNFGMTAVTDKNIRGRLTSNTNFSVDLDKDGKPIMKTMQGNSSFSIKNGSLINFKPLQNLHSFLFKNRDFTDISFAEIKDDINFTNGSVQINRMEINSSVLSLYVEGVYGLEGKTDMSIQVPLSNLTRNNKKYKPENQGTGKSGGMSVFLRAHSNGSEPIKISYDPLKRFRKN